MTDVKKFSLVTIQFGNRWWYMSIVKTDYYYTKRAETLRCLPNMSYHVSDPLWYFASGSEQKRWRWQITHWMMFCQSDQAVNRTLGSRLKAKRSTDWNLPTILRPNYLIHLCSLLGSKRPVGMESQETFYSSIGKHFQFNNLHQSKGTAKLGHNWVG